MAQGLKKSNFQSFSHHSFLADVVFILCRLKTSPVLNESPPGNMACCSIDAIMDLSLPRYCRDDSFSRLCRCGVLQNGVEVRLPCARVEAPVLHVPVLMAHFSPAQDGL